MTTTTAPKPFCLVLMPFSPEFTDTYKFGIKGAAEDAGAYSERIDEQVFEERILDRIYNQIAKADIIVADMTGQNANVFYEVGYAHALNKPTILLTKHAADIPFDLKHFTHIIYGGSIGELREVLTKRIRWQIENPRATADTTKFPIELWMNSKPMSAGECELVLPYSEGRYPAQLTVQNISMRILEQESFRIVAISPTWVIGVEQATSGDPLPDGTLQHSLGGFAKIFPGEYRTTDLEFAWRKSPAPTPTTVQFRVFTSSGSRDFPLTLTRKGD